MSSQEVLDLLGRASQVDKEAEKRLKELENAAGFRHCLVEITSQPEVPVPLRLLAAIVLKGSVHSLYSRAAKKNQAVGRDEERTQVASVVLQCATREANKQIRSQLCVCVSRIARTEWPEKWPNLFPSLLQFSQGAYEAGDMEGTRRCLEVMEQMLSELSSKRMKAHKLQYEVAANHLLPPLLTVWTTQSEGLLTTLRALNGTAPAANANAPDTVIPGCELCTLLSKCIQWLVVYGQPALDKSEAVHKFFSGTLTLLPELNAQRSQIMLCRGLSGLVRLQAFESLTTFAVTLGSCVVKAQHTAPIAFVSFLGPFLEFFYKIAVNSFDKGDGNTLEFEQMSVLALNFIAQVVRNPFYQCGRASTKEASNARELAQQHVGKLMTPNIVQEMAGLLITRFLLMTNQHISEWEADIEEVFKKEQSAQPGDSAQDAAGHLLWALSKSYAGVVCSLILDMFARVRRECPPGPLAKDSLLMKEAVCHAFCIASIEIINLVEMKELQFDFGDFFSNFIGPELKCVGAVGAVGCKDDTTLTLLAMIQRQIVVLLGEWFEQVPTSMHEDVFALLTQCVGARQWMVGMASITQLHNILSDIDFDDEDEAANTKLIFAKFRGPLLERIFQIMAKTSELEARKTLLEGTRLLVAIIGKPGLAEVVAGFTGELNGLWQRCAEDGQEILRGDILETLACLVKTMEFDSVQLHPLLIPLIADCVSDVKDSKGLLKDCLVMWLEVMKMSSELSAPLMTLFDGLCKLIEVACVIEEPTGLDETDSKEELGLMMSILQSYIVLGGGQFMANSAGPTIKILNGVFKVQLEENQLRGGNASELKDVGVLVCMKLLIQMFPNESAGMVGDLIKEVMRQSLIIARDEESGVEARTADDDIFAALLEDEPLVAKYCCLIAVVLLYLPHAGRQLIAMDVLTITPVWLAKVNMMARGNKKLSILGLSCILPVLTEVAASNTATAENKEMASACVNCIVDLAFELEDRDRHVRASQAKKRVDIGHDMRLAEVERKEREVNIVEHLKNNCLQCQNASTLWGLYTAGRGSPTAKALCVTEKSAVEKFKALLG